MVLAAVFTVVSVHADLRLGLYPGANFYGNLEIETVGFEITLRGDWRPPFLADSVPALELTADLGYSVVDLGAGVQNGVVVLVGGQYHLDTPVDRLYVTPGFSLGGQYSFFSSDSEDVDPAPGFVMRPQVEVGYEIAPALRLAAWTAFRLAFFAADGEDATERSLLAGVALRYRITSSVTE